MIKKIDTISLGGIVSVRDGLIEKQEQGDKVFRLESGDPSFDVPRHVSLAIRRAIRDGHTHYTAGAGIPALRSAIVDKLERENKIVVSLPDVFVTNGAMHALYIAFRAICSIGDEVIVPNPTWTETADNVTMAGGVPVRVDLDKRARYLAAAIKEKITKKTVAIVINSPHNPTGAVLTSKEIRKITELAERRGLWIISDEAYEHVLYDGREHVSPASMYSKTISIFSFSKSYAMSGLRLGYLAVDDVIVKERISKLLRCTINGVNSATQWGGIAALNGPQDFIRDMVAEYKIRRDALWAALKKSATFVPIEPQGAFYCWCKINDAFIAKTNSNTPDWALTNGIIKMTGIGSAPGSVFGPSHNFIRFAFSCSTPQVIEAAKIISDKL